MQAQSPIFLLPREVRDRIYEFYLAIDHADFGDTLRPHHVYLGSADYSQPIPALMCTCKRAYRELASAVHNQAVMRVETHGLNESRIGFAVHGTLRFDRLQKLWLVVTASYPNWNRWLYFFKEVAQRARNLKTLIIDWWPRPVSSAGWEGRMNTKKEDDFFAILEDLEGLQLIQLHGDIPAVWRQRLDKAATRVVYYPFRWWRERGMDL
ncbi:hypothetical protein DL768_001930 [Monosporascus sp. mg162]|nr:hypothetical protein DL768_001930 [Monosporascus sp. mg162]